MNLDEAYRYCGSVATGHYENFPVASLLLPRRVRPHVAAVYAFARHADDLADEGSADSSTRLAELADWREQLESCLEGKATEHPVFLALADTVRRFSIPASLFHDLLDAFAQDATRSEYDSFEEVLQYCRRSADPVGRIVLALFGLLDGTRTPHSDALCTGLQLANFWQDVSVDRLKPRIYLPLDELQRYGLAPSDILEGTDTDATRELLRFQVQRSREYFAAALPLLGMVPRRLRLELTAIWRGGWAILDKIAELHYNVLSCRPELSRGDMMRILVSSIRIPTMEGPLYG